MRLFSKTDPKDDSSEDESSDESSEEEEEESSDEDRVRVAKTMAVKTRSAKETTLIDE